MAINKNALIRYQTLDKCFSNPGRMFFYEDLLEACNEALSELNEYTTGIKRRQLFDDIRFMESEQGWSIPLGKYKFGRRTFYRYEDSNYSINNQPLNKLEEEQIKSAIDILSKFKGMPQFEWINVLIPKIKSKLQMKSISNEIISFDANEYLHGIDYLGDLFNAILYKKVLELQYKSFKSKDIETIELHPYYLKQYNNRWFLFGYYPNVSGITNLALDRIIKIEETSKAYIENTEIDFNEYFEDIIGVTKPQNTEIEKIILMFKCNIAPYILTKPLHGSQKIISNTPDSLTISIEVIPNYELESLILSFGDNLVVLEPLNFKNLIKKRLITALEKY